MFKFKKQNILLVTTIIYSVLVTVMYLHIKEESKAISIIEEKKSVNHIPTFEDEESIPKLHVSPQYFTNNFGWSTWSKDNNPTGFAIVANEADTITEPSTSTLLDSKYFRNTKYDLPNIKTQKIIDAYFKQNPQGEQFAKEQILEFGDLAKRFILPDTSQNATECTGGNEFIGSTQTFDVDADGENEKIINLISFGANQWSTRSLIVKNNTVIFDTICGLPDPTITTNNLSQGFYIEWGDNFKKRIGYKRTRFIWDGTKFTPIYEQTVRYVNVSQ